MTQTVGCTVRAHRWLLRRDLDAVLAIEREAFEFPWSRDDFIRALGERATLGAVCEDSVGRVCGYAMYRLRPRSIELLNLAVAPRERRTGVGRVIVGRLVEKGLALGRRRWLVVMVRERNLPAQLFFRACGLRCVHVRRGPGVYRETDEDGYVFVARAQSAAGRR
ncbi:MAG: GNAT family N-acetyltransferase [Planctomycetota bacterium]